MALEPLAENEFENGENDDDMEMDMVIDWRLFTQSLSDIVGDGILSVFVLSSNGTLLSSVGAKSSSVKRILPLLVESIWRITSDAGKKFVDARGLELMFANCKMGRIAISAVADEDEPYFVCLLASNEMECRYLKVKSELISDQLAKILLNERDEEEDEEHEH